MVSAVANAKQKENFTIVLEERGVEVLTEKKGVCVCLVERVRTRGPL